VDKVGNAKPRPRQIRLRIDYGGVFLDFQQQVDHQSGDWSGLSNRGGYFERAGPSQQSRCLSGGGAATETERVFVLKLNGRHQDDAANGQRGYYIEKRFHGFSPVLKTPIKHHFSCLTDS